MPFIRAGDITVHYLIEGPENAPAVMLSNSLGTSLAVWDAQAASLRQKYRVVRYDTRGHGLTDVTPVGASGYTMDQLADDAAALIKALGLKRVHFCGLSIGGMLGQRLAAKAPELLASLILCDTAPYMNPHVWDERIAAIRQGGIEVTAEATMQRWFTKGFHAAQPDAVKGIRNMLVRTPADGYIGCAYAFREVWSRPGLPMKTRSMLTIAMLTALGRYDELAAHIRATRQSGVSREEVKEILMQAAIYAGVPAAMSAFSRAQQVYAELDKELDKE